MELVASIEDVYSSLISRGLIAKENLSLIKKLIPPMLLFVALSFQLYTRVSIINSGYQLETLRKDILEKDVVLRQSKLEYAYLTRPKTLISRAETELGMKTLYPENIKRYGAVN